MKKSHKKLPAVAWIHIPVFAMSFVVLCAAFHVNYLARELGRFPDVRVFLLYSDLTMALVFTGLLGTAAAIGLRACAQRVAFLEAELAKRARNDDQ